MAADERGYPDWISHEIMDILRYDIAGATWRWQDRRNMRLVCRRWHEAVLLPKLFADALEQETSMEQCMTRTSCLRIVKKLPQVLESNFSSALLHNRTVTALDIYNVTISGQLADQLAAVFEGNRTLRQLTLSQIDFPTNAAVFLRPLLNSRYIQRISIRYSKWKEDFVALMRENTETNLPARHLCLRGFYFTSMSFEPLLEIPSLTSLSITDLVIKDAEKFANSLQTNTTLRKLNLSHCRSNQRYLQHILKALASNRSLEKLCFDDCDLENEDLNVIIGSIRFNTTLKWLKLKQNRFGTGGIMKFVSELSTNQSLRIVNIGQNRISDSVAFSIKQLLETNTTLERLTISKTGLSVGTVDIFDPFVKIKRITFK